jgi:hypothetical protein
LQEKICEPVSKPEVMKQWSPGYGGGKLRKEKKKTPDDAGV